MKAGDLIAALGLPDGSRVDQRVPKSLLLDRAPTTADRRRIREGVEELRWVAALKPTTVSVPVYRDKVREYLEIAVLSAKLRAGAKTGRLAELIHRAVPYPVVLVSGQGEGWSLSLAHKRRSQGEEGATVLDGEVASTDFPVGTTVTLIDTFRAALPLARQPRANLFALYQGWMDALVALLAGRVTGAFTMAESPVLATARHEALRECARLDAEIAHLRAAAARERQIPRQVDLNLELRRVERRRIAALKRL